MTESTFVTMLIEKTKKKYWRASKDEKSAILDHLQEQTGRPRKSLIRSLNRRSRGQKKGPGRPRKYDQQCLNLIKKVLEAHDYIAAERFHHYVNETIQQLEELSELENFDINTKSLVQEIPLGSLKSILQKIPKPKAKYSRPSGNSLKREIPIRTGFKKNITPGFFGVDFVDHTNDNHGGRFLRTFCAVDPLTTWVSRSCALGKDRQAVVASCEIAMSKIPYKVKGMHSDNEPNLLYTTLRHKAKDKNFMVTRTRPYKKEDNGHVEQKNGDKVRRLVGYKRMDTYHEMLLLQEIYRIDDLYQNHFIASMRLVSKQYDELGKIKRKKLDRAQTAYERTISSKEISLMEKSKLIKIHKSLNRVKLKRERDKLLRKLSALR